MAKLQSTRRLRRQGAVLGVFLGLVGSLCVLVAAPASAAVTPVMDTSVVTAAELANWYRSKGKTNGATVDIDTLAALFINEGAAEGVAGDVAFAQSIVETGYFGFSSRVPGSFNNFSGLGAVDGGTGAAQFPDAQTGVRAQIQHLRAYADPKVTVANLANPLVDPRFNLVSPKGKAPNWEQFGGGIWASDPAYSGKVLGIYQQILTFIGYQWAPFRSASSLVKQTHRDILARAPSSAELVSGVYDLEAKKFTPAKYLATLVDGEASKHGQPVARLYLAALGRLPDAGGLEFWTQQHYQGRSLLYIVTRVLSSSEFARRFGNGTNTDFVNMLYQNVLGRPGDWAGTQFWVGRLASGNVSRASLVVSFSESPEHVRKSAPTTEACVVFLGMVRRAPDPSALSWWSTKRASGSPTDVLTSLVLSSAEYAARI